MMQTREKISSELERVFTRRGFAAPGVAELKKAANVSLRTLYRYFPSKTEMIIGALDFRHHRYRVFLARDAPEPGDGAVLHIFQRLDQWMETYAPKGCLSINALSDYPEDKKIEGAVQRHKQEILQLFEHYSGRSEIVDELYLIHEGLSAAWPLFGTRASRAAEKAVLKLFHHDAVHHNEA
ncbi:MAG: TetR/AcrR family transcriptional regulator [Desulfobacteraceae bacterium]